MPYQNFVLLLGLAIAITSIGCWQNTTLPPKPSVSKTIQMDDCSLFVNGEDWVYTYPVGGDSYHIIGHGVEFQERIPEKIVVKLDSQIELDVPISNKSFLVDSTGFHDVQVTLTDVPVNAGMIETVVNNASR